MKTNNPIDFVITWVDGSDPKWLSDRKKYAPANEVFDESRFRDWGLLKYWFRSVEANAPWVRKIHFVTYGHVPSWLNTNHPKLHIVKHEDFIDKKYLPTFNSCAIEVNLHKIPGLSENFVYFNDDTFINKPAKPSYFFKHGKPKDSLILKPIYPIDNSSCGIQYAGMSIINDHFSPKDLNKKLLYTPKNNIFIINNLFLAKYAYIVGFNSKHLPQTFNKSIFQEANKAGKEVIESTQSHKFRTNTDVSQLFYQYWQYITGNFYPAYFKNSGCYHLSSTKQTVEALRRIKKSSDKLVCINDNIEDAIEANNAIREVQAYLESRYRQKSSYEK